MAEVAVAAEAAAEAARAAFCEAFSAARAAAAKNRPGSVSAARAAWRQGPHWERVAALMVRLLLDAGYDAAGSSDANGLQAD